MTTARGQHLIGRVVGGCVLEKLLGYGGSSAVFLAQQHTPERQVAIKVFLPRSGMDVKMQKDFYIRFLREAEAARELDHANILPIYSYGEQDGLPYIIMPYMQGGTLHEYIRQHGRFSLDEAYRYLEQIASALDYAHEHGRVHCDVKPANILIASDGRAMLSDFGIAHIIHPETARGAENQAEANGQTAPASQATQRSQGEHGGQGPELLMGTPDYISPEQALGHKLDGRSDVYSLGIMLFFLLAGRLPFKADSTIAMALLHVHEPPPSLGMIRADISPALDRVMRTVLAKSPDERFQTVGQFCIAFGLAANLIDPASIPAETIEAIGMQELLEGPAVQPVLLAAQPVVHVAPVLAAPRPLHLTRILIAAALLLLLTIGAAFGTSRITSHLTSNGSRVQATVPAALGSKLVDGLTNSGDWPTSSTFFFSGQQYHIQNKSAQDVALALYADHLYSNFRLSVTATEVHGSHDSADYYGVVFRSSSDQSHYYVFEVATWGSGEYEFLRFDGHWKLLASGPAPSLITTTNASNIISVQAVGNTFSFSINHKSLGNAVTDPSKHPLAAGELGLYVEANSEVAFSHLYISPIK